MPISIWQPARWGIRNMTALGSRPADRLGLACPARGVRGGRAASALIDGDVDALDGAAAISPTANMAGPLATPAAGTVQSTCGYSAAVPRGDHEA